MTQEQFIEKAKAKHGDKVAYTKVEYKNNQTKICIVCPIHGEFWQRPKDHLKSNYACPKCGAENRWNIRGRKTTEEFVKEAREIHGDKYDYSLVEYETNLDKVKIICPKHGVFEQTPANHLNKRLKQGCPYCSNNKKLDNDSFIEKAKQVHGNTYDYTKVEYVNVKTKVCIVCPIHGEFWQTPDDHLRGTKCPKCKSSHLENELRRYLTEENIQFEEQKRFEWLGKQSLDFYLPQHNMAIECQGIQHFKPREHFGGEVEYTKREKMDKMKKCLCEENKINLLYYSNLNINYPYKVYENKEDLIKYIESYAKKEVNTSTREGD